MEDNKAKEYQQALNAIRDEFDQMLSAQWKQTEILVDKSQDRSYRDVEFLMKQIQASSEDVSRALAEYTRVQASFVLIEKKIDKLESRFDEKKGEMLRHVALSKATKSELDSLKKQVRNANLLMAEAIKAFRQDGGVEVDPVIAYKEKMKLNLNIIVFILQIATLLALIFGAIFNYKKIISG